MNQRDGLHKICACGRRRWPKCGHSWHFAWMWQGTRYRVSLDRYVGHHVEGRTKAAELARDMRDAIRAGTFGHVATPAPSSPGDLTLEAFAALFLERYSQARGKTSWKNDRSMIDVVCRHPVKEKPAETFGALAIALITEDDIQAFLEHLRTVGRAASTRNQYLQLWKAMSKWGRKKGYLERAWLDDTTEIKREKHAQRSRRLAPDGFDKRGKLTQPGEERRLLAAATPRLQRLIVAALETGCRRGELLSLQWQDVSLPRREFIVRALKAKTRTARHIPISERLAGVLDMARTDPRGKPFKPEKFVFGDATGEQIGDVKKAWTTAVLKAHGHTPVWIEGTHRLAPESQTVLKQIDLHFHDLRHEAGSRFLEAGWPVHEVQAMLGHANLSQTSTYLNATRVGLHRSMARWNEANQQHVDATAKKVTRSKRRERPISWQSKRKGSGEPLVN